MPSISSREFLDTIELLYLGVYFLVAAAIFLASYFRAPSGVLRQQLKWVTGGTFAGIVPFFLFYVLPHLASAASHSWMKLSVFSLALIPLCFGYAIIRYRLMDVDIIFKRGLAYTFATAGVVAVYFSAIALIGELSHAAWPKGPAGAVVAIVTAAFLFQPLRDWVQARLDHFFYRDRLDYRRTLIEFGRTLTNEVRLEPLLESVLDRISQTLLVDRLAVFLENAAQSGAFVLSRSMGLEPEGPLDLSFLDPSRSSIDRSTASSSRSRAWRARSRGSRSRCRRSRLRPAEARSPFSSSSESLSSSCSISSCPPAIAPRARDRAAAGERKANGLRPGSDHRESGRPCRRGGSTGSRRRVSLARHPSPPGRGSC